MKNIETFWFLNLKFQYFKLVHGLIFKIWNIQIYLTVFEIPIFENHWYYVKYLALLVRILVLRFRRVLSVSLQVKCLNQAIWQNFRTFGNWTKFCFLFSYWFWKKSGNWNFKFKIQNSFHEFTAVTKSWF